MKKSLSLFALLGVLTCLAVLGAALLSGMARAPAPPAVRVSIEQIKDADIRVTYVLRRAQRELIFRSVSGGYRERRWALDDPAFKLVRGEREDRILRKDGARFNTVSLTAKPDLIRLPKEYQPVAAYGAGGALVYTGHFWPVTPNGARANATFSLTPAGGGYAAAFGARAPALIDWRSPEAHPAFVYLGPLAPVTTDYVMALVDPAAPDWVVEEFHSVTAKAFDYFAEAFGAGPQTKPNLFLTAPLGRDQGRLSYSGDALPRQFQITLEGAAWREPSAKALDIFRQSTIHEAFHLWQAAKARPGNEETAAWIHEGGADAVAAEAMAALGFWDAAAFAAFHERAREECAAGIEDGPLASAHLRGDFRALYGCGVVVAEAVARADGTTSSAFWRDFLAAAAERDGYSAAFFYDFVAERTGDRTFARAVRRFVETPFADPHREIERLHAAAGAPLAPANRR